ncbi:MAG: hypothetical protein ABI591_19420 [Kofleriaceae bacterium]
MRWIWSVVIACLVAATGMRPIEPTPRTSDQSSELASSPAALPVVAGRRADSHLPVLHLPVATVPEVPALDVPRVAVLVVLRDAHPASSTIEASTRSSRGPPLG